jgi:hypothetical protein
MGRVRRRLAAAASRSMISVISFELPYGEIGLSSMPSATGPTSAMP